MSWYAFDGLDDATDATRRFLFPFSFGRWFRLAVITLFLGSSGSSSSLSSSPTNYGPPSGGGTYPPDASLQTVLSTLGISLLTLYGVIAVVVGVALILAIISSTMRFVFVDAIRTDDVRVRGPFARRLGMGIRLFVFQFVLTLLFLAPAIVYLAFAFTGRIPLTSLLQYGWPVAIAVGAVYAILLFLFGIFLSFTNQFVVPVMIREDVGVSSAWRRFWPTLRGNVGQFFVYLISHGILGIVIGFGVLFVGGILALIVLLIGALIALGVAFVFGGPTTAVASTAGVVALAIVAVLVVLLLLAVLLPIKILAQTFLTTYELAVLGHANSRFALLPDGGRDDGEGAGSIDDDGDGGDGGDGRDHDTGSRSEIDRDARSEPDESRSSGNEFVWPHNADEADEEAEDDRPN